MNYHLDKYKLKIFGKNITTQELFNAELLVYKKSTELSNSNDYIVNSEEWAEIKEKS